MGAAGNKLLVRKGGLRTSREHIATVSARSVTEAFACACRPSIRSSRGRVRRRNGHRDWLRCIPSARALIRPSVRSSQYPSAGRRGNQMVWSGAVASATPMVPATGALFEDEGHVPGVGRARHRRRRRLPAAAANDDLLAGAQVLGLHRYQTSPSTSSPAPSCFAVRGLIAVGLPKLLSQASAARLDDMYACRGSGTDGPVHEQLPQMRRTAVGAGKVPPSPAGKRPRRSVCGGWSNGNTVVLPSVGLPTDRDRSGRRAGIRRSGRL